jgi:hypothetical protein
MAIVVEAAAGVHGSGLARKRNDRLLQGLAAHEREFSTAGEYTISVYVPELFSPTMRSSASKVRATPSSELELPSASHA